MLLRISLVIAILAGLAALYFSHVNVSERITTLTTERDDAQTAEQQARQAETTAKAEAKRAGEEFDKASRELAEKTETLLTTSANLAEQRKRADTLFEQLNTVTAERNEAQQNLTAYVVTGETPSSVLTLKGRLENVAAERDAFIAENKILLRNNTQLKNQLSSLIGPGEMEVEMTPGLKGKVVAVDPRYNFVVLDIGGNQGVLENGQLLVNRGGKLVAKVRVTKVEPNRSIANIIPEWELAEVMEGDQVLY